MLTNILSFQKENNLSIVEFRTDFQNSFEYFSGRKAISQGLIEVNEVSNEGSVNHLLLINSSTEFIFLMDGDILSGAKQNRVLNTSVLIAPSSKTVIPVSCVEQGRWSRTSDKFSGSDHSAPSSLRASKAKDIKENLKNERGFKSNQCSVWESVNELQELTCVRTSTMNLSDIYENKKDSFDEYLKKFKPCMEANGLALFIKNKLLHIDIFNKSEIYQEYFPLLTRGAALEAYKIKGEGISSEAEAKYKTMEFLDNFDNLKFEEHTGVGVGIEKRFETEKLTGFKLNYNSSTIHLTAFNIER